jgi:hypothetical protein
MDRYLLKDHWAQLVVEFKDEEREQHGQDGYSTEQLAVDILDHLRVTRFRQWGLVSQKRGEEFERMVALLIRRDHTPEAIQRFLDSDELWAVTLDLATQ